MPGEQTPAPGPLPAEEQAEHDVDASVEAARERAAANDHRIPISPVVPILHDPLEGLRRLG